ncbi:hypothetical protein [Methylobacterium sp. 17Sr1-1]|uniref:hypothetical protein n=1 Tax=Methylobacterium sp. 17Sr1-1 TaxID=2202826 RepID=UPI0013A5A169|nr:hypothetical protein [Methylobacterium sp. 17Sr1-1]
MTLIALALTGLGLAGPAVAQTHRWTPPDGVSRAEFRGFFQHWHGQGGGWQGGGWQGGGWQGRPHRWRYRSMDLNTGSTGDAAAPEPPGLTGAVPPGLANGSGNGNGNGNMGNGNGNNNTGNNNGNGNVGNGLGNGFSTNGNGNGLVQ